jgi:hypothetical protein
MNSKGSKAILILVVGLTAFSSAMKELNQIRQFGSEVSQFVAEWSDKLAPAEIPRPVLAKVGTCHSKQSEPAVELPWLNHVAETEQTADIDEPEDAPAPPVMKRAKIRQARPAKVDPTQFEVRIMNDEVGAPEVPAVPLVSDFTFQSSPFKFKSRKQGFIRMNPRDREMLKSLNHSINLRISG